MSLNWFPELVLYYSLQNIPMYINTSLSFLLISALSIKREKMKPAILVPLAKIPLKMMKTMKKRIGWGAQVRLFTNEFDRNSCWEFTYHAQRKINYISIPIKGSALCLDRNCDRNYTFIQICKLLCYSCSFSNPDLPPTAVQFPASNEIHTGNKIERELGFTFLVLVRIMKISLPFTNPSSLFI